MKRVMKCYIDAQTNSVLRGSSNVSQVISISNVTQSCEAALWLSWIYLVLKLIYILTTALRGTAKRASFFPYFPHNPFRLILECNMDSSKIQERVDMK
jgi:hypothetical protein